VASVERRVGGAFCLLLAVTGLMPLWSGGPARLWALVAAALLLCATLFRPSLLAPLSRAWLALGERLHRFVSPLALGCVFFGVVTPTAWARRLLGKDELRLKRPTGIHSYWIDTEPSRKRHFLDQF
jgi:hypothetical protein